MQLTIDNALEKLIDKPGAKIVTLTSRTRPKLNKKHRLTGAPLPYKQGVERIATRSGIIGCSYESSVNRQRDREGGPTDDEGNVEVFHAEKLWNGKGEHDGPLTVRHKGTGKRYITFKPTNKTHDDGSDGVLIVADQWLDVETGRTLTQAEIDELDYYQTEKKDNKRQGTDREIFWRTIELENILQIRHGDIYDIKQAA